MDEQQFFESPTDEITPSLAWVKPYYTRAGDYWGPPGIGQTHRDRLDALVRLCGPEPKRVLELGAGTGETAAAVADAGHSVVAVEFSPTRAPHIQVLSEQTRSGSLTAAVHTAKSRLWQAWSYLAKLVPASYQ